DHDRRVEIARPAQRPAANHGALVSGQQRVKFAENGQERAADVCKRLGWLVPLRHEATSCTIHPPWLWPHTPTRRGSMAACSLKASMAASAWSVRSKRA